MAHLVYKPHLMGPTNDITTPDVMVDRITAYDGSALSAIPLQRVVSRTELQWTDNPVAITPAYALVACGGGTLLAPGALLHDVEDRIERAEFLISRCAWRLRNVTKQFRTLQFALITQDQDQVASMAEFQQPQDIASPSREDDINMARGTMAVVANRTMRSTAEPPLHIELRMSDMSLDRALVHTIYAESVSSDRWDDRPLPRYTVGPVGDVKHYI